MILSARQRGISSLAILFYLLSFAFILTCVLTLGPLYMEARTVAAGYEKAIESGEFTGKSIGEIRGRIQKTYQVNMTKMVARDIKFKRDKGTLTMDATYERRVPLFGNIDVVVKFDTLIYELKDTQ